MGELVYNDIGLKLENENNLEHEPMLIDIIDFNFHISGGMDRGANSEMDSRYHIYISEDFEMGSQVNIDLEVLVRYVTNFKLNAFLSKSPGTLLIPDTQIGDEEVHYVTYETNLSQLKLNFWSFLTLRRYANLRNMDDVSWRITDIDGRFGGYRR
mmetsp:Transcript_22562/g.22393  ORF Transcript_22562/g.22393 Transcript_22562/m.22393 type:complete len:155 (-) Transcript_22562:24-488(-)